MTTGISGQDIKLMGDWCSDVYMTYLDLSLNHRITNMVQFIECMDDLVDGGKMAEELDL